MIAVFEKASWFIVLMHIFTFVHLLAHPQILRRWEIFCRTAFPLCVVICQTGPFCWVNIKTQKTLSTAWCSSFTWLWSMETGNTVHTNKFTDACSIHFFDMNKHFGYAFFHGWRLLLMKNRNFNYFNVYKEPKVGEGVLCRQKVGVSTE